MAGSSTTQGIDAAIYAIKSNDPPLETLSFYQLSEVSQVSSFYDTEKSLNINIPELGKKDDSFFKLLQALNESIALKSLDFNRMRWSLTEVNELCNAIKRSSTLKRTSFQQCHLGSDGVKLIAEMLKKNGVVKELSFSDCGIGPSGSSAIASALKINESLEEIQIWEDSIGSRGAEELAKMIEVNSSLRFLTILDMQSITAYPLVSAALGRNRNLELHVWNRESKVKHAKVVELIPINKVLRIYRIDTSGCYRIVCALARNSTVESLDISGNYVNSKCAQEFRRVLEENRTLKHLNMSNTSMSDKGVHYIAAALFRNNSLQSLQLERNSMGGDGIEHLLCPLSRFKPGQAQANTSLKSLSIGGAPNKMGNDGVNALVQMISTNQSLLKFAVNDDESMSNTDFIKVLKALQRNTALKALSLKGCKGVAGDAVLEAIMDVLQVNPWLEEIDLSGTPLQASGEADHVHQRLRQNTSAEPQANLLRDMPKTMPKSVRVFLCGQEFAGKTTLCNSLLQTYARAKLPTVDQIKTFVNPIEPIGRTQGIKIKVLEDDDNRISIWDLAGQHEFHAFHDLMFPGQGSPSFFLIICSLFRKPENREPRKSQEIEEDLVYWLRFIVSNSRRAESLLAHVTVVFTHIDKSSESSELYLSAVQCVYRLRDRFTGFVELCPTVYTVDARSSGSVNKVARHVQQTTRTILERVPKIYEVCDDLRILLSSWKSEKNKPVMRWEEFAQLCQLKVPSLRIHRYEDPDIVEERRRAVASSLHKAGEIIYFQELDFIIVNCEWFCEDVLGRLVRLNSKNQSTSDVQQRGFTTRKELEVILKESLQSSVPGFGPKIFDNVHPSDLVSMMLKLELCYEQDPGKSNSKLFIPAILEEGRYKPQRWQIGGSDCIYTGRHLECDDSNHTFLTPGFFPRLQVHLHNKILGSGNRQSATYKLEKHLISIFINGIDIRVELGGEMGYYIDVLACSSQDYNETLKFLHHLVIQSIQRLCASSAGCQGVILVEGILRPQCVEQLIPPRNRRGQFIFVEYLKQELLSVPAESMYNYQHTWNAIVDGRSVILGSGFDYARDLLSEEDFRDVLQRRYHDLYRLAVELDVPSANEIPSSQQSFEDEEEDGSVSPTISGIAKGVEMVLQRLKIIEQDLKDIKQEIQGLRYYEHSLLIELHRKVNNLVNFSVQLEERKVPHMFYFVRDDGTFTKRLVTDIVSGMTALQLHLLCEYRREMHVVDGQLGINLMKVDNRTVQSIVPYVNGLMKMLTFALKVGAHVVAGMGEMVPDLSREVAKLADSSFIFGRGLGAAHQIEQTRSRGLTDRSRDIDYRPLDVNQFRTAQQWLVDFLRTQKCLNGKAIAEKFGLWRVRYTDDGQIAWVCSRHKEYGTRIYEVIDIPID
ncbi:hypothetical protein KI387_001108 [Taxus chinensis]|uniref:C-terminal of Roc (COR) domain-containing protein n=1 Tax=Taxus chinensis TaxID=29808 RepID=A0AA38LNP9_TAXCH|nr:hypothetical protein KI387_001108 [Taxus chinensis]